MNDEAMIEKITEHDRHIDTLSHAIEELANTASSTNVKLDKVVEAINTQNVLIERMNNMESNIRESFNRVHEKVRLLEQVHGEGNGCTDLNVLNGTVKSLGRSVDTIRVDVVDKHKNCSDKLEKHDVKIDGMISGDTIRWFMGLLATGVVLFGTYVTTGLHRVDTKQEKAITEFSTTKTNMMRRVSKLERNH